MGTKAGDDGQKKRTQAAWDADTKIHLEGLRMYVTDGAHEGQFKIADGENTFTGMGDGAYFIPGAGSPGASQAYVDAADGVLQDNIDALGSDDIADESGWGTANVTEALDEISATFPVEAAPTVTLDTGSTNTAIDPGAGIIRFNHGTIASVTEIAVSDAINGVDKGDLLLGIGGILQLRLVGTTTTIEFRVVSAVHTTWTRFTVVYLKGALPADATVLAMRFLPIIGINAATQTALDLKLTTANDKATRDSLGLPSVYFAQVDPSGTASGEYNQLGGAPVVARAIGGTYTLTITGAFTVGKTSVNAGLFGSSFSAGEARRITWDFTSANVITFYGTDEADQLADTPAAGFFIDVNVYP